MVLASGVWPFHAQQDHEVPKVLSDSMEDFTRFYVGMHNGRKLAWLLHMCRGELTSTAFQRRYTFMVSCGGGSSSVWTRKQ